MKKILVIVIPVITAILLIVGSARAQTKEALISNPAFEDKSFNASSTKDFVSSDQIFIEQTISFQERIIKLEDRIRALENIVYKMR